MMIAVRRIWIFSFLLLGACAPKQPLIETAQDLTPAVTEPSSSQNKAATNEIIAPASTTDGSKLKQLQPEQTTAATKQSLDINNTPSKAIKNASASKISSWVISGAMAARSKGKGWSASVNWQQQGPGSYQIRLSGPLGSGTVLITRSGGTVTLRDGPKTASSSNAESLLQKQTGISLPVSNLFYWVRGIPAPGSVQGIKYDPSGRLLMLRQGGYTIEYLQYTSAGQATLPTQVRLQGNGVFIKLVIKRWQL